MFQELGYKPTLAWARGSMGEMGPQQGDLTFALRCYEESLSLYREAGHTNGTAWMLYRLGSIALHEGESQSAAELFVESLTLRNQVGNLEGLAEAMDGLAGVASADRRPERAVRLFAAAEALRKSRQIPLRPLFREPVDRFLPVARAQLDPKLFAAAWAEGQAMTSEEAMEYALTDRLPSRQGTGASATARLPRRALEEFAGLTAREREVAILIAQGKSNRAIAEALVVQVKTVEVHVTHILGKLGFTSRAQIAGWSVGNGLAAPPQDTDQHMREE